MTTLPFLPIAPNWQWGTTIQPGIVNFPNPPKLDGDYELVAWGLQTAVAGDSAAPTNNIGMTVIGAPWILPTADSRMHLIHGLAVPSITGAPGSVQFTRAAGAAATRQILAAMLIRGVSMTAPVAAASTTLALLSTATVTIPALTAPEDNCLGIATFSATWGTGPAATIVTPPAGWTLIANWTEPIGAGTGVSRNTIHLFRKEVDAGSSGACAAVFTATPLQATGQMVLLRPVADAAPARTYPAPATVTGDVKSYAAPATVTGDVKSYGEWAERP